MIELEVMGLLVEVSFALSIWWKPLQVFSPLQLYVVTVCFVVFQTAAQSHLNHRYDSTHMSHLSPLFLHRDFTAKLQNLESQKV